MPESPCRPTGHRWALGCPNRWWRYLKNCQRITAQLKEAVRPSGGVLEAEGLAVVIVGEDFRITPPADQGAQGLLGGILGHVVLELVEEAALGGGVARPLIQYPTHVGGKGHIGDQVLGEELLTL